jgi:hypothetical protein
MLRATLYRPLRRDETPPPGTIRVRLAVPTWADFRKPKAGYCCRNRRCSADVVLVEANNSGRTEPHLMTDARCPFCGQLLEFGGYFATVVLAPAE